MNPEFSAICHEPEGEIERKVYPLTLDSESLKKLWEKQRNFRTLMNQEILTFPELVNFFTWENAGKLESRGIGYVIDDFTGIFWLSSITWPIAEVHYTFFDRRHKGRIPLVRAALNYAFNTLQFERLWVRVGLYAKVPIKFVESVGFKKEGRLRKALMYKNTWYDANMYGLLREDTKEWEHKET